MSVSTFLLLLFVSLAAISLRIEQSNRMCSEHPADDEIRAIVLDGFLDKPSLRRFLEATGGVMHDYDWVFLREVVYEGSPGDSEDAFVTTQSFFSVNGTEFYAGLDACANLVYIRRQK